MIAGIAWRVALVAVALVTAGVQLDRQSEKTPAFAQSVPAPLRSVAQLPIAAYALDADNHAYTLAEAERLVRRRPLPALHLRILAQAQFVAGEADQSALTIQYAAQRGWREPLAQESVLRLALANSDMPEAARRFAALFLRRDTEDALLEELAPQVLAEPGSITAHTLFRGSIYVKKEKDYLKPILKNGHQYHFFFWSKNIPGYVTLPTAVEELMPERPKFGHKRTLKEARHGV